MRFGFEVLCMARLRPVEFATRGFESGEAGQLKPGFTLRNLCARL